MLATIAAEVKGSSPTVSRTHCFAPILPDPWLLQSFYPLFLSGPWTLEGRGAVCFPTVAEHSADTSLFFNRLWVSALPAVHYT